MGFTDKLKEAVGMGSDDDGADQIGQQFAEELETQEDLQDESFEDETHDQEPIQEEWETAYQFFTDWIEDDGFMSGKEFVRKAMYYKVKQSPKYRDRIQHGTDTINRVTDSMRSMEQARGGGTDLTEVADEIRAANEAIEAAEEMGVSEDVILGEFAGLGRDVVGLLQSKWEHEAGDVDVDVDRSGGN